SVRVSSVEGQGSVFVVSLPTGRAHLPPAQVVAGQAPVAMRGAAPYLLEAGQWIGASAEPRDAPPAAPALAPAPERAGKSSAARPGRVLVVDDNQDMRDYLARILSTRWSVETAADGRIALERARVQPPDLVVSDVMMPGLDGFGL